TRTGGRYRAQQNNAAQGDLLDFAAPDTQFDTLGALSALPNQGIVPNSDILVVYNLFSDPSVLTSNAYTFNSSCGTPDTPDCNTALITGTGAGALPNEARISFANRRFPLPSPGNRFHVVQGPVSYECAPN